MEKVNGRLGEFSSISGASDKNSTVDIIKTKLIKVLKKNIKSFHRTPPASLMEPRRVF